MTKRIFKTAFVVGIIAVLITAGVLLGVMYGQLRDQAVEGLVREAGYIEQGLLTAGEGYFDSFSANNRVTWIGSDGSVLYDSVGDSGSMENHADREEFIEAKESGTGDAVRVSSVFMENTIYYARLLEDGTVIRVSMTQAAVGKLLLSMLLPAALIVVLAGIVALLLARRLARSIVQPINQIDLDHPENCETYEELTPLLNKINHQNQAIQEQIAELKRRQREFGALTDNMSEGFLMIDAAGHVLAHNASAVRLLGAPEDPDGESVLSFNRSPEFRTAVDAVLQGEHSEQILPLGDNTYQIVANPVYEHEHVAGAVILILDVTEKEQRYALRREFTANVSHELKTPLTSISGFAELMKNGIAPPEDVRDLASDIYDEAQRLIRLVDDIMRLSQLDESEMELEKERVDLYELCEEVVSRFGAAAREKQVTIELAGSHQVVLGVRQIIDEIVYNLCDNAVKYNRAGGSVTVTVGAQGGRPFVRVQDTGIGIAPEHQGRVFERFYRVDKSHSHAIGGTGLGLSIVKHGAACSNAEVSLQSEEGKGTAVTVQFEDAG